MASCLKCHFPIYKAERGNIKIAPNGFVHIDCEKALGKRSVAPKPPNPDKVESLEVKDRRKSLKSKFLTEEERKKILAPFPPEEGYEEVFDGNESED